MPQAPGNNLSDISAKKKKEYKQTEKNMNK